MAEDHAPTRDIAATSDNFCGIVKSAGEQLSKTLREELPSDPKNPGFVLFPVTPYEHLLGDVRSKFANEIFRKWHPVGRLEWSKISVITRAANFNENTFSLTDKDRWLLPLFVEDERRQKRLGQPISFHTSFSIAKYDIYIAYEVVKES